VYQQISALILARFPVVHGHIPAAAYQALFWFSLASVGLSIVLVAFSEERRTPLAEEPRQAPRGWTGSSR
jgi:hypothetical protein